MLAAMHRLRRSNDLAAAVRGGRRAGRGAVVVHLTILNLTAIDQREPAEPGIDPRATATSATAQPARTQSSTDLTVRAGFVVSKAVGGAVMRNRVRRRLRHLVAERLDHLPPGATLVVRALPAAAESSYSRLGADLDAAIAAASAPRQARTRRGRP